MSPLFGICRFIFELSFGCSLFGRKLFSQRFGCLLFGLHCVMKKIGWQLVGHIFGGKIWPWFVLLTMRDQNVCLGLVWGQKRVIRWSLVIGHTLSLNWHLFSSHSFLKLWQGASITHFHFSFYHIWMKFGTDNGPLLLLWNLDQPLCFIKVSQVYRTVIK